jgi:hypothetical protein
MANDAKHLWKAANPGNRGQTTAGSSSFFRRLINWPSTCRIYSTPTNTSHAVHKALEKLAHLLPAKSSHDAHVAASQLRMLAV